MTAPEEAVNWSGTRRHLSIDLSSPGYGHGWGGTALCHTETAPVRVHDQEAADWEREILLGLDPRAIGVLPMCKRCETKAATQAADYDPEGEHHAEHHRG